MPDAPRSTPPDDAPERQNARADEGEDGSDTSGSSHDSGDTPGSTGNRETRDAAPGVRPAQENVGVPPQGAPYPSPPPIGYGIPGTGAPYHAYPPYPHMVIQQPLSGVSQQPVQFAQAPLPSFSPLLLPAPLPPAAGTPGTKPPPVDTSNPEDRSHQPKDAQTPLPAYSQPSFLAIPPSGYAIPGPGASTFHNPHPGSQPQGVHTSPYGYSQAQYDPYQPLPNWISPQLPPPPLPVYPYPPIPDTSDTTANDGIRTIEHRFAGYLFTIRTDAKAASKKLRVKPVDNHVEYYCSGVLLTKIRYRLEKDIFSLYEDSTKGPLQDAELRKKIEILIGPIVAGLFEEPWSPEHFNFAWGVEECEDIGDGNFFHVDVKQDFDSVNMYDSRSRELRRTTSVRPRPIVEELNAFNRIPSVGLRGDQSRSVEVQYSIDHAHLLNVLREIELLTAMELAKRSNLAGSAVASVIGRKDDTLTSRHMYKMFNTEVPTLFGLFVSKLSHWSRKISDLASYVRSLTRPERKYGDEEEERLGFGVPHADPMTPDSEIVISSWSSHDRPSGALPVAPIPSNLHGGAGIGFEDEDNTTLDGQSQASDDDTMAWYDVGTSSDDGDQDGSDGQSQASDDGAIPWYEAGLSSDDEDQGGSDGQLPPPNENLNAHLNENNGGLSIDADATHTERIPVDSPQSISDSRIELSDKPSFTLGWQLQLPSVPTTSTDVPKTNHRYIDSGSSSQPKASNAVVSGNQKQQLSESQKRGTKGEGNTNSQKEKPPNSPDGPSHACSPQELRKESQCEHQSESETKMMRSSVEREESETSLDEEQTLRRQQSNRQTEEGGLRMQDSSGRESANRDKDSSHESDDIRREQSSTLHQPDVVKTKPDKKVRFTVPDSEQSKSGEDKGRDKLEDVRHRDEFNEARRAHLRAAYQSNPLRDYSPAYSYNPPAYAYSSPVYPYVSQTPTPQSSMNSQDSAPSAKEQYQEAVAAGQIYDVPPNPNRLPKREDSLPNIPEGDHEFLSLHGPQAHPTTHTPPPTFTTSAYDELPRPAASSKHSGRFSRRSSHSRIHPGDLSSLSTSTYTHYMHGKINRLSQLVAKDTLSVILWVVIVILSILAIVFDPAGEENWFKRVEEGAFVMFSLGIPLLLAILSHLTPSLDIMLPSRTREVRSMRDLEKLYKHLNRADFVKQLQRELLFNEELSKLFSSKDACYKLSRTNGSLNVPERAQYRRVFREVWFFGEEYAYNKILGKAFRYQQKDNVLMIETESVDIEGVIVHVRRRRGKYTFGSSLERYRASITEVSSG